MQFIVTHKFEGRAVRINALHSDGSFATLFEFAPDTLREGWNLSIASGPSVETTRHSSCGNGVTEKKRFLSPSVQLTVTDGNGDPVKHFHIPLNISTFAHPFDGNRGECFGYNNDGDARDWKCSEEFSYQSTRTRRVTWTTTSSDHLTSFAVLLGSTITDSSECDGLDWISIASLSMIAAAFLMVLVCSGGYYWSVGFRALVGGYKREAKMSAIQNKVTNKQKKTYDSTETKQAGHSLVDLDLRTD